VKKKDCAYVPPHSFENFNEKEVGSAFAAGGAAGAGGSECKLSKRANSFSARALARCFGLPQGAASAPFFTS
jgi:hypothetical protein